MPVSLEGIKSAVRDALARSKGDEPQEQKVATTRAVIRRGVSRLGKRGDLNRKKHHVMQTHMGMAKPIANKFMNVKVSKRVAEACTPRGGV